MKPLIIYNTLSQLSVLVPVVAGAVYYKKLSQPFRLFFWFFVFSAVAEAQAYVLSRLMDRNNIPGMHVFSLVEFWAFSMMYYFHFKKNSKLRPLIVLNAIVFTVLAYWEAFVSGSLFVAPTLSRSYSSFFIVLYTLAALYTLTRKEELRYSWEYPMFWLCIGALAYFGTNTLYFMFREWLAIHASKIEEFGYHSHAAFNIIANCIFAHAFRISAKWKTS